VRHPRRARHKAGVAKAARLKWRKVTRAALLETLPQQSTTSARNSLTLTQSPHTRGLPMKRLLALFFSPPRVRPRFAEDDNLARAMQIAELKWLLAEIAVPSSTASR
jgi:hypothetical protein